MRMLAWPGSFLSGSSLPPAQCGQILRANVQNNNVMDIDKSISTTPYSALEPERKEEPMELLADGKRYSPQDFNMRLSQPPEKKRKIVLIYCRHGAFRSAMVDRSGATGGSPLWQPREGLPRLP